jgi:ADP-ribose pyrophosphatase YjhB (NUDIX family)
MSRPSASEPCRAARRGASIAVFKADAVLLVRRARAPLRGLWSLPGGTVEPHEEPRQAALRELLEETAVTASLEGLVDTVEIEARDDGGNLVRYRLEVFYGRYFAGTARAGGDAAATRWAALADLPALEITPGTAELIGLAATRLDATSA